MTELARQVGSCLLLVPEIVTAQSKGCAVRVIVIEKFGAPEEDQPARTLQLMKVHRVMKVTPANEKMVIVHD
ncbi:hypothetical protein SBC1_39930 (plasmid) [Caballeronia sp. SBC1]|uniref:hypothetical protein n=1 Tax=unclassified Caballeronia TaxID=2646786 RepID=UPI0013E1F3EF|nr:MULTISPECIES: hypothetical protein [unclassified Caballeronia]QIE26731.1 hypothetical protein SBC2_48010 [Caballeronia sp. SBC2]QIN63953.1 hypothetical protein SBC1_39930 [Caballeronia sp. SBC1]